MARIECVGADAARQLAVLLTRKRPPPTVEVDGNAVNLPHATARYAVEAVLTAVSQRLAGWASGVATIERLGLYPAESPELIDLREHLDGCSLAASMCKRCSGAVTRFGRVAAVRQLLDAHGEGNCTSGDVAELMLGLAEVFCAECRRIPARPAVREIHHPTMGSLALCETDARSQERRNLR